MAVIPNDHISADFVYPSDDCMTSGAIQYGVPTNVFLLYPIVLVTYLSFSNITLIHIYF